MRSLLCAAITASLLMAGSATGEDRMYKWVDENGNVSYQDRPPPDESGQVQSFAQPTAPGAGIEEGTLPDVDVTLYAIEVCDACDLVRDLLQERGVPFTEKPAGRDAAVQEELKTVAGVLSVPVLVVGDEVLPGFNRDLILRVLDDAGFPSGGGAQADVADRAPESGQLSREDMEQAARATAPEDDGTELFDDDAEAIFSDSFQGPAADDDVSQWEEIPEDEQIRVGE